MASIVGTSIRRGGGGDRRRGRRRARRGRFGARAGRGDGSITRYSRASSNTPGAAPANRVSSVYWPQECHRLRLTSLAPHLGQIQTADNAGGLWGGSIATGP